MLLHSRVEATVKASVFGAEAQIMVSAPGISFVLQDGELRFSRLDSAVLSCCRALGSLPGSKRRVSEGVVPSFFRSQDYRKAFRG